jgi:ribosome biogenesis GTPase A
MNTKAPMHWFPGHMAKAMRRLAEDLKLVDAVIEVIDARIPRVGANPALSEMIGTKPRVVALTRSDLADPAATKAWVADFTQRYGAATALDAKHKTGLVAFKKAVAELPSKRAVVRALIVGVPNAGKSTIINVLAGRNAAKVEDRAGVTRAQQWIRVANNFEVLDTAGILPMRVERPDEQWKLAVVNAVPRALFDPEEVALTFHAWSAGRPGVGSAPSLETFAQRRGFVRGGSIDVHNAAWAYLKDLGEGKFGRLTLDDPDER